ncbi:maltase-glucoamylase-like [Penaeus vannamei]|uniref:maltase-glucoamylase-like n=1 Tax=Penaeus vannamei TaxID=6689 RepID=UPI00387FAE8E
MGADRKTSKTRRRTIATVCGLTAFVAVTVAGILIHDTYVIPPHANATCPLPGKDGANESQCLQVGCIWAPRSDAPSCYFPPASSHGYTISDALPDDGAEGGDGGAEGGGGKDAEGGDGGGKDSEGRRNKDGITKYTLKLKPSSAAVVEDMKETLQAEVIEYGDHLLRIKVTVPGKQRYEVPVPLDLPAPSSSSSPLYKVSLNHSGDFSIKVTRDDTNEVIFDTSIGGFTYAEQFLQVSTRLPSSNLYGLGEHSHASFKHDLAYKTWPMFARDQPPGNVGENLYGVHPMYLVVEENGSSHAVLWLNSNAMEAETMPLPGLTLRSIGGIIDLFFFLGPTPEQVVAQYTSVIGRPFLPPYWSLGFQLCRYGYNSLENLTSAVSRTRRHGIPQDVQYADIDHMHRRLDFTYDEENFAGLPDYIRQVKEEGLRFVIILDPAVNAELPAGEYPVHEAGVANDVYITWPEGQAPDENFGAGDVMLGYVWPDNRTAFPDFFRQKTRDWWTEQIVDFHKTLEFDGLWIDMNEPANFGTNEQRPWNWPEEWGSWSLACPPSPWDDPPYVTAAASVWGEDKRLSDKTLCMVARQGEERELRHYDVHNLYGWSETKPTLEALQAATGKRGFVVTRSTYPSSGRWAGHWLGDNAANWNHLGDSITGMLEFNLFGIPYVGADICGFFDNAEEEMCERWMELGAFYPYSRSHNTLGANDHDPGLWPSVAASSRKALRIRYTLLPYLYTLHFLAATTGSTVVRPLFFEFPNIVDTWNIDDQFLWGSWLMVAPVIQHGMTSRRVYFPRGIWYDYYQGAVFNQTNGVERPVLAPRAHVPLFVRGGGVLVTQRPRDNTAHSRKEPLGLIVAPDWAKEASGTFFWDDGEGIDTVDKGEFYTADITYAKNSITWTPTHDHAASGASALSLSDVRVFGVDSRPSQLTLDGTRWNSGDWHYHAASQVLEMFDLEIPISSSFTLSWKSEMDFKIPCPISYKDWNESMEVTQKMCQERNCVWDESHQIPCSIPPPSDYGYEYADNVTTQTDTGFKVRLRKRGVTLYGDDAEIIIFEVFQYSDDTLRFKFTQEDHTRYEVPLDLDLPTLGINQPLYEVVLSPQVAGELFFFRVVRVETGNVLLDTSIGGLTFSNQFLSLTTLLASKNIYGLGENTHSSFRHDLGQRTWPVFARDQGPAVDAGELNLYGAHPYFQCIENDGNSHGLLLLNSNAMDYQLLDYPAISYRTIGGVLDFYMVLGPEPEGVVSQYTALIHRPVMPPYWALGFQLCRYGYGSLEELQAAVNRTREAEIPHDVQYGDIDYMDRRLDFTYDQVNYAGLPEYVLEAKENGLRFVAILDPAINAELDPSDYPPHKNALDAGAYIEWGAETNPEHVAENNGGGELGQVMLGYVWPDNRTAFPSFFKDAAKDWWISEIESFYNTIRFDGLWIDMNEPANFGTNEQRPWNWPEEWGSWSLACPPSPWDDPPYVTKAASLGPSNTMADKTLCLAAIEGSYRHYDVHNLYGWAQTEPTLRAARRTTGQRSLVISRSTFPGSGRWAGHWLGDNRSIWPDMHHSIIGMLEFNLFGIPYIGADICGFFGNTTEELCERWMELGAFYPFSRNHNQIDAVDQDPALWESVATSSKKALEIRYRLLPYLYTLFYYAHTSGNTVVRPLMHEFPHDRRTLSIDDQFLWGGGLLISPVLAEGETTRSLYLPFDAWYDYYTGKPSERPGERVTSPAPRDVIPLHIRGGHVLPTQRPARNTQLSRVQPMGVIVAIGLDRKAKGDLFWDDGEGEETIQTKEFGLVHFEFVQDVLTSTILQNVKGSLGGLKLRDFEFLGVEQEPKHVTLDGADLPEASWSYDAENLKLVVSAEVDLNTAFAMKLGDIWRYKVDVE